MSKNTQTKRAADAPEAPHRFKLGEIVSNGATSALCSDCGLSEGAQTHEQTAPKSELEQWITDKAQEYAKLEAHAEALAEALRAVEAFWSQPPTGPGLDAKRKSDLATIRSNNAAALSTWEQSK